MTITTDPAPAVTSDAALIAAVQGGPAAFTLYVASGDGDVHDRLWDLLEQAQDLAGGSEPLKAAVARLVDVFWPPVDAEDVFPVGLYGVVEDVEPFDLDGAA